MYIYWNKPYCTLQERFFSKKKKMKQKRNKKEKDKFSKSLNSNQNIMYNIKHILPIITP